MGRKIQKPEPKTRKKQRSRQWIEKMKQMRDRLTKKKLVSELKNEIKDEGNPQISKLPLKRYGRITSYLEFEIVSHNIIRSEQKDLELTDSPLPSSAGNIFRVFIGRLYKCEKYCNS